MRRPSYAEVMSTLAFFVAVGGVGWAAATIDSADVVNDSLKSKDLKNEKAVKSSDVIDGSLTGDDIQVDTLGSVDAERLSGFSINEIARGNARRQTVSSGFSSTPLVTPDEAGTFTLFCNDPATEDSELFYSAPPSSLPGSASRDSWVSPDNGPLAREVVANDDADTHSVVLDPGTPHRVIWQTSPVPPASSGSGDIVTAVFSFSQANTPGASCEILGHAVLSFAS